MRRWPSADTPRVPRVVRALWPDRNPLRRTLDRVEAAVVYGLVVAFLAAAPLAALIAGRFAYSVGSRAVHAQQAAWHRVPAVLLTAVPTAGDSYEATAPASWKAPDGTRLTGTIPVPLEPPGGHTVTVWVDAAGRLTGPPLRLSQVRDQAALAAMLAPVVVGFLLLCAGQLARGALDWRRLAAWDADWQATEPQWTGRR